VAWLDALPYREEEKKEVGARWALVRVDGLLPAGASLLLFSSSSIYPQFSEKKKSRERGQKFRRISNRYFKHI
jgi:hypothetical protein